MDNTRLSTEKIQSFQKHIWDYYQNNQRSFAWRETTNPYHILVSEIMLQQTQTYRVAPKYDQFIETFPDVHELAQASLRDVLALWQGLGYNRRGKALHEAAKKIATEYNGQFPTNPHQLLMLPGIGPYTAHAVCTFAFNKPYVFLETNIRAVYIHCFFGNQTQIHDKQLYPLIEQTVDTANPRHWYYALMDYGVMLKKKAKNPSRKSAHHTKQSKFEGSDRQIRGEVIRLLTHHKALPLPILLEYIDKEPNRTQQIIYQLHQEKLIDHANGYFFIP